jgi:hypothetical protein
VWKPAASAAANSFSVRYPKLLCGRSSLYSFRHAAIFPPRIKQVLKPAHHQTLFSQPSVKTFDVCVLRRLPLLNTNSIWRSTHHARKWPTGKFRPIVAGASSGLGGEEGLVESNDFKLPADWTPDGGLLLYMNFAGGKGPRLWIHQTAPEKKDYPLLRTNFSEEQARFSPDGRWLAYQSEETGKAEIFVVPFASLSSKWQVSTAGGEQVMWRRDGKELFYVAPDRKLMAVAVDTAGVTSKAALLRELFATLVTSVHHTFRQYDVAPDGQKFIINTVFEQSVEPITVYANWERELKR